jgi:hypothetical protein
MRHTEVPRNMEVVREPLRRNSTTNEPQSMSRYSSNMGKRSQLGGHSRQEDVQV